jgi:hypothetical protein
MTFLIPVCVSVFLTCPKEYHIDSSGWNGVAQAEIEMRITAMDGTVLNADVVIEPESTPEQVRGTLRVVLRNNHGCQVREVGKNILVLERAKKSPIRSVEFKSKGWKPDVRGLLIPLDKK